VRIGIDLLPLQSPGSRGRGVGRYVQGLVKALARRLEPGSCVCLVHERLPFPDLGQSALDRCMVYRVPAPDRTDIHGKHPCLDELIAKNALGLTAYLHPNPFEQCPGYDLPSRSLGRPLMASLVHDLIPLQDQERYFANPDDGEWFRSRLHTISRHDLILTNSDATRADCFARLGIRGDRVVTVGAGVDRERFANTGEDLATLSRLGVAGGFFLLLGGADSRKNMNGQINGWRMSIASKKGISLIVAGKIDRRGIEIDESIRFLGEIDDSVLGVLYRHCLGLLHVSHAEGFGLPIVEAMSCGAAVVAGDDATQRQVLGDAGLSIPSTDTRAISEAVDRIANDASLRADLQAEALVRARMFNWDHVAERALNAIESAIGASAARSRAGCNRRLAMFTPLPPKPSGIADYALRLARELTNFDRIELFHDEDYVPDLRDRGGRLSTHDHRTFRRRDRAVAYDSLIYHMGNSWFHRGIYHSLIEHPGITVLHDPSLAGFHAWYGSTCGGGMDHFRSELAYDDPVAFAAVRSQIDSWSSELGGVQGAAARRGIWMNRRVIERSKHVMVHSPWCREQIIARFPQFASRISVVPLGAEPIEPDPRVRETTRARFGLNPSDFVVGCFGILTRNKMNDEVIEAFARVAPRIPRSVLLFAGQDWEDGAARRSADRTGLGSRIRFLGRVEAPDYIRLVQSVDLNVSLRRPPTFGETSASLLDGLRCGIPTIVNDAGTLLDLPDHVIERIHWDATGVDALAAQIASLAINVSRRLALGVAALEFIRAEHSWTRVASEYARIIDRVGTRESQGDQRQVA
jgi:glycosyltransferase involved in cell wall biosynthesis